MSSRPSQQNLNEFLSAVGLVFFVVVAISQRYNEITLLKCRKTLYRKRHFNKVYFVSIKKRVRSLEGVHSSLYLKMTILHEMDVIRIAEMMIIFESSTPFLFFNAQIYHLINKQTIFFLLLSGDDFFSFFFFWCFIE